MRVGQGADQRSRGFRRAFHHSASASPLPPPRRSFSGPIFAILGDIDPQAAKKKDFLDGIVEMDDKLMTAIIHNTIYSDD